jgi:hypothetical protein
MPAVHDIWFRTDVDLQALAHKIGLTAIEEDGEDYWHWVIGEFRSLLLDITRTHRTPANQTDTRVFLYPGHDAIPSGIVDELVSALHGFDITPVFLGSWVPTGGNDFEKHVVQTRTKI